MLIKYCCKFLLVLASLGIFFNIGVESVYAQRIRFAKVKTSRQKLRLLLSQLQKKNINSSVQYYDPQNRKVVFDFNSEKALIPASIVKVLTSFVFIKKLGLNYRFKTEIYSTGVFKNDGTLEGDLTLKGYGDPSLNSEQMAQLAQELYLQGLRKVTGDIWVDNSFLDEEGENISEENEELPDSDRPFDAVTLATSYNWNSICFYVSPGAKVFEIGKVQLDPENPYIKINNLTQTAAAINKPLMISREVQEQREIFTLKGDVLVSLGAKRYWRNVANPKLYAGFGLLTALNEKKINVMGSVRAGFLNTKAQILHTVESKPLIQIIQDMNKNSLNFVATLLVKTLGAEIKGIPGSIAKGTEVIKEELSAWGLGSEAKFIESGSGLNRNTFLSSQLFINLILNVLQDPAGPELLSSFPVSNVDGTLKSRFKNAPYQVRAKTGNLNGVASLLGLLYQTPKNPHHFLGPKIFSIILNHAHNQEIKDKRDIVDEIVDLLSKIK